MIGRNGCTGVSLALAVGGMFGSGCGGADGPTAADHTVYFEGNVYDGATGMRLDKTVITSIAIAYRDKTLKVSIADDGRFVSLDPLPTWQDYMVTIETNNYRAFVSHNLGFEVPASLAAMNTGLASISTIQTFSFDAYLFPKALKAPAVTLPIAIFDDMNLPSLGKAAGTIRLRPQTQSGLQVGVGDGAAGAPRASRRVWANDEDLLTKTLIKSFTAGKADFAAGELVYGVQYEISIYDVDGYQPVVLTGAAGIVAGSVTSKTIQLAKALRDPLRVIANTATMCTPSLPTATDFGSKVQLTFSEDIEIVGTTYPEDIDNGLSIAAMPVSFLTCPLKTNLDPTKQERGSKVDVAGAMLTLSFNPSVGITDPTLGTGCMAPTAITAVTYGNLQTIVVQPMGDASRKRGLAVMLQEFNPTVVASSLSCPTHP
jgi:hypothetical protein